MSNAPAISSGHFPVARNAAWNMLGMAPLAVAIFSVPVLIKGLGAPRFGVLSIGWVVMGYFAQCGLGRATAKFAAEAIAAGQPALLHRLVWSAAAVHLVLGTISGCLLAVLSTWLTTAVFRIPVELQGEATWVFYLLACTVPVVVVTECLRSVLEARARFDLTNAVQAPAVLWNYVAPLGVLYFTNNVAAVVAVIALSRCFLLASFLVLNLNLEPSLRSEFRVDWTIARKVLGLGGWATVSSLIAPIIATLDRFTIGAVVSLSAVAWYTTSYEAATKLWFFSGSLLPVMFPVFSSLRLVRSQSMTLLYRRTVTVLIAAVLPIVTLLLMFSNELLGLWVGAAFAERAAPVLQWLAVGVAVNVTAQVPFTLLQSAGKAHVPAILQVIELPLYGLLAWRLAVNFGIDGVAFAWTIRAILEATILFIAADRTLAETDNTALPRPDWSKLAAVAVILCASWQVGRSFVDEPLAKLCFGMTLLIFVVAWEWNFLIGDADRQSVARRVQFAVGRLCGT